MAELSTKSLEAVAGIDIAKQSFNVYIIIPIIKKNRIQQNTQYRTYRRDQKGVTSAIEFCKKYNVKQVVMESTSVYHIFVVNTFRSQNIIAHVINSGLIRTALKKPKRDKLDARRLAELLIRGDLSAGGDLSPSYVAESIIESDLKKLCRLQDKTTDEQTRIKNRIHKIFDAAGLNLRNIISSFDNKTMSTILESVFRRENSEDFVKRITRKRTMKQTQKDKLRKKIYKGSELSEFFNNALINISDVDLLMLESLMKQYKDLSDLINQFQFEINELILDLPSELEKRYSIAKSLPGIGDILGIRIVVEFGDLSRFKNRRQVSSYTGLEPHVMSSGGKAQIRGITKSGNKHLRKDLFIAAMAAARSNKKYKAYYTKLRHRGRKKRQALCAVARKIAVQYYFLVRQNIHYDIEKDRMKYHHMEDW